MKDNETLVDMDKVKLVLAGRKCIKEYCYIIHDKDTYSQIDEERNPEHKEGTLKPAHIHLLLRFMDNQPQNTKFIAKWFGLTENFVQKIKGKWEDALLYQTHRNAPDKYQYSSDEVHCNFDYESVIADYGNKSELQLKEIIERILNGEIKEYNKTLEIDNYILVRYARQINEAFKVRAEHLQATIKERDMECIFITGPSGCGKTTLAKKIAKEKGLAYFISSSSNDIMDSYNQQEVILLDDMRPSVLGLSDLLKLLDNYNTSSVKSRYKNKFVNAELIIITTVMNIDRFYANVFAEAEEPITQLKRRCGTYIRMDKETINVSVWDNKTMRYTGEVEYKNNLLEEYIPEKKKTAENVKEHVSALMPFLEIDETDTSPFHLTPLDRKKV
jgi:adenylate kinase family enzyme